MKKLTLSQLRESLDLSKYAMAKRLEMSPQGYAQYEAGGRNVGLKFAMRISEAFQVHPSVDMESASFTFITKEEWIAHAPTEADRLKEWDTMYPDE